MSGLDMKPGFSDAMPWDDPQEPMRPTGPAAALEADFGPAAPLPAVEEPIAVEATTLPPKQPPSVGMDLIERTKAGVSKLADLAAEVATGVRMLAAVKIADQVTYDKAFDLAKLANQSLKIIEDRRKALVKPHNDLVGNINDYAKLQLAAPLENAITGVRTMMIAYNRDNEERKRQEQAKLDKQKQEVADAAAKEQERLAAEQQAAQAKVGTDYAARRVEIIAMPAGVKRIMALKALEKEIAAAGAAVEKTFETAKTEANIDRSLSMADIRNSEEDLAAEKQRGATMKWSFEVIDATKVPDIYKAVVDKLVNAAIKGGAREIAGLRIFQEDKIALR